jgi:hypothetical protein
MKYYKVIGNSEFIGVGCDLDMRRFQKKHNIILACDSEEAQYIQVGDILYHTQWMLPVGDDVDYVANVDVIEISEEEYNALHTAAENGEMVSFSDNETTEAEDETTVDKNEEITIEYIRSRKIAEMNNACTNKISSGFDLLLSDGSEHHFSLTAQDQMNLVLLNSLIASGVTSFPYHADNEESRFYSLEDIKLVLNAAINLIAYHSAYCNSLKTYILSLNDTIEVSAVEYGIEIPSQYQSDVLRTLLEERGQQ